jgi:hypothetical protein
VDRIGLAETIGALRQELAEAIAVAEDEAVQFPVEGVELEFHVGVTRNVDGDAGINFWVVELGKAEGVAREEIQRVSVTLGRPVVNGRPVRVRRELDSRP